MRHMEHFFAEADKVLGKGGTQQSVKKKFFNEEPHQGGGGRSGRDLQKKLEFQLAEIISQSCIPLPIPF